MSVNWYHVRNAGEIVTPALLIYPERIAENIDRMIRTAGSTDALRPHVKTHKMSEVIRMQIARGISQYKCSTIVEADVTAAAGGSDIMLAMQPVGVNTDRFFNLMKKYPAARFSTIVDDPEIFKSIATKAESENMPVALWVDINNGMNRTGISPSKGALDLCLQIAGNRYCRLAGLHVYDGHLHESDPDVRRRICEDDLASVNQLISEMVSSGLGNPLMVAGGTPTFHIHAGRKLTQTSPGTCLLWDSGYSERFADLHFLHAAVVMSRVVSKPASGLLCLDLGHKAIAGEMPHPRVRFFELHAEKFINHSEEHLVVETPDADSYHCGDIVYGIPWHICPTVPRYPFAYTVRNNLIEGKWKVDARDREIM